MSVNEASDAGYFRSRLRGDVSLERLFWIDMIILGTALNLTTSFAALVVLGLKWPTWAWVAVYLSPLPYNLFLVAALWRTSERSQPGYRTVVRTASFAWLVVATLI